MNELVVNLHMHTPYSDGTGTHSVIASAALQKGVDVLIITDHNILVAGMNDYYRDGKRKVLLLVGEEIHDQDRVPQKNHLLVFGAERELSQLADNPQALIDAVRAAGGLSFIAHPDDAALPAFGETDITWTEWGVSGFTGIEIWNGFSELKSVARGKWSAIFYAYFPDFIPHGPQPETLRRWDELTSNGTRIVAVGGSDAHAQHASLGPLRKVIFPYEYHFSTINTHVLVPTPLTGDLVNDRKMILDSLSAGHCFIGNDLPASTRGFSYTASSKNKNVIMGDEISLVESSITLQAKLPSRAEIRLIQNNKIIKSVHSEAILYTATQPGVYRIEAHRHYHGRLRGWIYSNPIYIK